MIDTFIAKVFGDVPDDEIIGIVQRGRETRGWQLQAYKKGRTKLRPDAASYYCISTLKKPPEGEPLRRLMPNMARTHAIVLDDIGTKIDAEKFKGKAEPHYVMETSASNHQYGYKFSGTLEEAHVLIEALIDTGYSDPGACDVHRLVRLPGSLNYKSDPPFVSRLVEENWDKPAWTFAEMVREFDLTPREPTSLRPPQPAWQGNPKDDVVFAWIIEKGMALLEPNAEGWAFIECPWGDEHSDGRTDAKWLVRPGTSGAFKCFHGSCERRDTKSFLLWCEANEAPDFESKWREKFSAERERLQPLLAEEQTPAAPSRRLSVTDKLLACTADFELFCDPSGQEYADVRVDRHRETHPVRDARLSKLLTMRFYSRYRTAPNKEALATVRDTLAAKAAEGKIVHDVHVRVAAIGNAIYIDLGGADWSAVEITAEDWHIVDVPAVRFRRARGALPLAVPQRGGSVDRLFELLNLRPDDRLLVTAYVQTALAGRSPFPILAVAGEQGTAKSTTCRMIRALVDPNSTPMRPLPGDERTLFIAAQNSFIQAFDNLSHLPGWTSDALCRLSTGGGYATRELYSDTSEILINVTRPVILNGIGDLAERGDLAQRSIPLTLQPIPPEKRMTEEDVAAAFAEALPGILGGLLDTMVVGLRRLPEVKLSSLPRMADFAKWATACDTTGRFEEVYAKACRQAQAGTLESTPVAIALRRLLRSQSGSWRGTWTDLLLALEQRRPDGHNGSWPRTQKGLSNAIRRIAPALREAGCVLMEGGHGRDGNIIDINWPL